MDPARKNGTPNQHVTSAMERLHQVSFSSSFAASAMLDLIPEMGQYALKAL
jgi:hypothetical protein